MGSGFDEPCALHRIDSAARFLVTGHTQRQSAEFPAKRDLHPAIADHDDFGTLQPYWYWESKC